MKRESSKRPAVCEKIQSGCMWGLIGALDHFRQGGSSSKILSDWRHLNRHAVGTGYSRGRLNLLTKFDGKCQGNDDGADNKSLTVDDSERSVKKHMEEEMSTKQHVKRRAMAIKLKHIRSNSGLVGHIKNHKKASKTCQRAYQLPVHCRKDAASVGHHRPSLPSSVEISSNKLNLAAMLEALCTRIHHENGRRYGDVQRSITCAKYDQLNEINLQLVQMSEAAEACIDQMFIDRTYLSNDGPSHDSKQFLDTLEILNLNKESFLKLLQDRNSLSVKHVQDLRDSQAEKEKAKSFQEAKFSECEEPAHTKKFRKQNMHYFLKKIRSRYGYQSKGSDDTQPPNRIVVLKPGPKGMQNYENIACVCSSLQSHHRLRNKGQNVKPTYFSFRDIKGKLKHAMGENRKEQHWISFDGTLHKLPDDHQVSKDGGKGIAGKIVIGRTVKSSTDAKRRDKIDKPTNSESNSRPEVASISESVCKKMNFSTVSYYRGREFDIYLEAKRHLTERLSKVGEGETFLSKQAPRTLGRILSSPEHDFLATLSPKRGREQGFVSAQMRFSPCSRFQIASKSSCQLQKQKKTSCLGPPRQNVEAPPCADNRTPDDQMHIFDSKPNILENFFPDTKVHENICSIRNDLSSNGYVKIVETNDIIQPGGFNLLEVPSEPNSTLLISATQSTDAANKCEEIGYLKFSRLESPLQNQPLTSLSDVSSSSSLSIHKVEVVDIKDREDHPSSMSVLEPSFIEDATSLTSTIPHTAAELQMQPRHIDFEELSHMVSPLDPKINLSNSLEDQSHSSKYVKAVLQASGLNWDKLSMKGRSSYQLLDPSLFNEVELFPIESCCDHKLLFDCINEVLLEVYQCYSGCSPWVSFLEPKIRPVSLEEIVVHEVIKGVNYLLPPMMPSTLEQIVRKDVVKSGTWMDIRLDTEDIVVEMVEDILEELTMETTSEIQI